MLTLLKLGCLGIYAAALAGAAGWLPDGLGRAAMGLAAFVLLLHVLEIFFAFGHIRRYPGPLATSVLLTLLFGVLHWKPLADAARAGAIGRS